MKKAAYQSSLALLEHIFYSKYEELVYYAIRYTDDESVAKDLVQKAFLKFWQVYKHIDSEKEALPLIRTIIKNDALNHLRHLSLKKRHQEYILANPEEFEQDTNIEGEALKLLYEAIDKLPTKTSSVIMLVAEGYSNNEIAKKLNVSVNTVKTLKYNGIKKLKTLLPKHLVLFLLIKLLES